MLQKNTSLSESYVCGKVALLPMKFNPAFLVMLSEAKLCNNDLPIFATSTSSNVPLDRFRLQIQKLKTSSTAAGTGTAGDMATDNCNLIVIQKDQTFHAELFNAFLSILR